MNPFILQYAENSPIDAEPILLDYSQELSLSVVKGTNMPAINLVAENLETFTKAGKEPTDFNSNKRSLPSNVDTFTRTQETTDLHQASSIRHYVSSETHTLEKGEVTDYSSQISRIAKRMSLESLTEAREATDVK